MNFRKATAILFLFVACVAFAGVQEAKANHRQPVRNAVRTVKSLSLTAPVRVLRARTPVRRLVAFRCR